MTERRRKDGFHYAFMYAGALPFVGCSGAFLLALSPDYAFGRSWFELLTTYSLIILTFMAGTLWGHSIALKHAKALFLASSNLIALTAWFGFVYLTRAQFLWLAAILFAFLLCLDGGLKKYGVLSKAYFHHRCVVTCLVMACLICAASI